MWMVIPQRHISSLCAFCFFFSRYVALQILPMPTTARTLHYTADYTNTADPNVAQFWQEKTKTKDAFRGVAKSSVVGGG